MQIQQIEFSKLRNAYSTVKVFVESYSYQPIAYLDIKLAKDLSLLGDDNLYLLEEFISKFELGHKDFDYSKHFMSESELCQPELVLFNLAILFVWLPMRVIELLTLDKINLDKPNFFGNKEANHLDLTFRDLIIWYLEKDFKAGASIKYKMIS